MGDPAHPRRGGRPLARPCPPLTAALGSLSAFAPFRPDEAGGAIIAWQRTGDIYAKRVNFGGVPLWTTNGVPLCTAAGGQLDARIPSDGTGGAVAVWSDTRAASFDIYAQRVSPSGVVQWTTNGVAVSAASSNQYNPRIGGDGTGGVFVAWEDTRGANADIYAQRLNPSGVPQWTLDGVAVCTATGNQSVPEMTSDAAGL